MFYFIVNTSGGRGRGKKAWRDVSGILKELETPHHAYKTKYPGHATKIATEILRRFGGTEEPIRLVVVGGDGTINEVLNGITDFEKVWLGVIPTGSGNDFVRGHKLPKKAVPALFQILTCEKPDRVDLGCVSADGGSPRLFGISSGIGMDAEVCRKVQKSMRKSILNKIGLGKLIYLQLTVESLFTMKTYGGRVIYDGDPESVLRVRQLIFLAGMNTRWEGGGVPMAPKAVVTDGKISTCVADNIPRWLTFLKLPILVIGKQKWLKGFTLRDGRTVDIEMEQPVVLHIDGEDGGDVRQIHMEALPGRLLLMKSGNSCACKFGCCGSGSSCGCGGESESGCSCGTSTCCCVK